MKKKQMLTIAAFALMLGVVAPVATIINGTDTYAIANDSVSSNINALIDEAMLTRVPGGSSATAYDYATLRDDVKAARAAIVDQTQRLIDQLIVEDGTTAKDYEGMSIADLISIARNRTGYEDASMAALQAVVNNAENNIAWHKNQIRNNLFDNFGENVDAITTIDEAITAAENAPQYDLYMTLLDRIQDARDIDNSDASLKDAYEAMEAIIAAMGAINPAVIPVNPIDPIEPVDPTNPVDPSDQTGGLGSSSDAGNQTDAKTDEVAYAVIVSNPKAVTTLNVPNTGTADTFASGQHAASSSSALALISGIVASCAALFAAIVRVARRNG